MQTVMLKEQVLVCTDNFIIFIRIHTHARYHRGMALYLSVVVDNQFLSDITMNYVVSVTHHQDWRYGY